MVRKADRDITKLKPEMHERVLRFLEQCKAEGVEVFVTEGIRSKARQLYLWSFGRVVTPELEKRYLGYDHPDIKSHPEKASVTQTLQSNHFTGEAIDIAFIGATLYPSWSSKRGKKKWNKVYDIAEANGLSSLFRRTGYADLAHLEFDPSWVKPKPPEPQYEKWERDEIKWAKKYIKDIDLLLSGYIFSIIALIHRAKEDDERYNEDN